MAAKGWKKNEQGEWVGPTKRAKRKAKQPRKTMFKLTVLVRTDKVGYVMKAIKEEDSSATVLDMEPTNKKQEAQKEAE